MSGHARNQPPAGREIGVAPHPADRLDEEARRLWLLARDCDRWGLVSRAERTRLAARDASVSAMIAHARAGTLVPDMGPEDCGGR